ncbi:MAG: hypothetical protein PVI99_07910, partial [Anaerolineales bacterium]
QKWYRTNFLNKCAIGNKNAPTYGGILKMGKEKKKGGFPQFGAVIHSFTQVIHIKTSLRVISQPLYVGGGSNADGWGGKDRGA